RTTLSQPPLQFTPVLLRLEMPYPLHHIPLLRSHLHKRHAAKTARAIEERDPAALNPSTSSKPSYPSSPSTSKPSSSTLSSSNSSASDPSTSNKSSKSSDSKNGPKANKSGDNAFDSTKPPKIKEADTKGKGQEKIIDNGTGLAMTAEEWARVRDVERDLKERAWRDAEVESRRSSADREDRDGSSADRDRDGERVGKGRERKKETRFSEEE
ncbi:MAG: hypothetical protein Q9207_005800, partial [Kuettlingeria erythrocarpa]